MTRKQFITEKYTLLIGQLNETGLISNDLLPSLDDIEVSDFIFLVPLTIIFRRFKIYWVVKISN
jgi:hypothetical protein